LEFQDPKTKTINTNSKTILVAILLMGVDIFGIVISVYLAVQSRRLLIPWLGGSVSWSAYIPILYLLILFILGMFLFTGLYPGYGLTAIKEIEHLVRSLALVFILIGITLYFLKTYEDFPRSIFIFTWLISILVIPVLRIIVRNRLSLTWLYGVPVLFILKNINDITALKSVQDCRRMGWRPLAVLVMNFPEGNDPNLLGIPILQSMEQLLILQSQQSVNTVVYITGSITDEKQELFQITRRLSDHFQSIVLAFSDFELGSIWVEPRDLEGRLGLEMHYHLLKTETLFLKRSIDLLGSILLIILTSPFWLLIAILINLDSPGPVFYTQRRVGKLGKEFDVIKFRSMKIDADEYLHTYLANNPDLRTEWNQHQKLKNDPRITRIGYWLRRFSLDELPQFWNVIKGEMSLIGPRAVTHQEIENYGDFASLILRVKPGITGWWQVMGRNEHPWERRTKLEVYYVSNWSLWMDAFITLKTIWVIVSGQGR
jgi:Undecaprenyl-phosphate galactose phosphotransferase WbaP